MKSANDTKVSVPQSLIILGPPGSGKTTLVTQFPKPYFLNADNNIEGPIRWLREQGMSTDFNYDDILHATLVELQNANLSASDLRDFPKEGPAAVPRACRYRYMAHLLQKAVAHPQIETLVLDSLTSIVEVCLDEVRRQANLPYGDPFGANTIDKNLRIQDWGAFGALVKNLLFTLMGSSKRLVVIGHVHTDKDELTNILKEFISVPGKLSLNIGAWFQEVWKLGFKEEMGGGKRVRNRIVQTCPTSAQEYLGLKTSVLNDSQTLNIDELIKQIS